MEYLGIVKEVFIQMCIRDRDSPGSKYDKALALGIPIWQEDEFLDKIEN